MRYATGALVAAAVSLGAGAGAGHAAELDTVDTFGSGGVALTPLRPGAQDRFLGVTPAPGGGTYAVGFVNVGGTDNAMALARVDTNGELDPTFDGDGIASVNVVTGPFPVSPVGTTPTGSAEIARGVGVQSDGKIVISGPAETATSPAPLDSRDLDIYVSRFDPDGTLDRGFGDAGTKRIDLSTGASTGTTIVTDQAWGLNILANDKIVVTGGRGTDGAARPGKTDRDFALIRLAPDGELDPTFSGGGGGPGVSIFGTTASDGRSFSENPRQSVVQPDGKIVLAGYASLPETAPGAGDAFRNRPILGRVLPDGTLDATFGSGGIATAEVLGPAPAFTEAYDIGRQSDGRLVLAGYGTKTGGPPDLVAYRFTADGTWDQTFGTGGSTVYDRAGLEDRGRDLVVLPDDRTLIVGSTATHAVADRPQLNALLYMLEADGRPDESFGSEGAISVHLGGPSDALFGSTLLPGGRKVVAAGYRGAASIEGDDAGQIRIDLSRRPTGPAGPAGPPGPPGPPGPQGASGKVGRITVRCKLLRRKKIRCTVRQKEPTASGTVRMRLRRAGTPVATGRGVLRAGGANVDLTGRRVRAGRTYALTTTLRPAGGQHTRFTVRFVLR